RAARVRGDGCAGDAADLHRAAAGHHHHRVQARYQGLDLDPRPPGNERHRLREGALERSVVAAVVQLEATEMRSEAPRVRGDADLIRVVRADRDPTSVEVD